LHSRFITGSLPAKEEEFEVKASIPDPEYLLALELDYALQQQGVSIAQAPEGYRTFKRRRATEDRYDKQPFYSYKGKTLSSVAYHTNMRSVNLFAEQLLCLIPYEKYGVGTTYKGSEFVTRFWEDKMKVGYRITDGSGLSRNNALSANHFTAMLSYMSASRFATDFENTLPVAGKSGTLSRVCRGQVAQGRLYAKSGTMSRIKSYAGYVKSSSGKKIAFAIIVNNYLGSSSNVVRKMEKVFNAMATY
jgi:serine-type D-Ala-D-Ala carboxypeptidase/endopeptidase (penicillin-binding protein 4)